MNTRWALTRRRLPDNRLIKTGEWALTQGWALARDNTVYIYEGLTNSVHEDLIQCRTFDSIVAYKDTGERISS